MEGNLVQGRLGSTGRDDVVGIGSRGNLFGFCV